jgi:hypothetical protein
MIGYDAEPKSSPAGVRALLAGTGRQCLGCGRALQGRQRTACSGKCRAASSRRQREETIRACLLAARQAIDRALATVPDPAPLDN